MEQFKCPVCANHYSESNPPRLLTMCGHTYCHHCIKHLIKRKDNRYSIRCPQDRLTITMDISSPSHFPKNIALLEAFRRRHKDKDDAPLQHNEFLACSGGSLKKGVFQSKSSISEFRQVFLGQRRTSIEEGICLLHRKPLDIVCVQEKIHICAQCALFGLHKGHSFTTLKDLNSKNKIWSNQINEIIEEKKHIDTKILNGEIEKELASILHKKKDLMLEEIDSHIKGLKQKIDALQKVSKRELQHKLQRLQAEVKFILAVDPKVEKEFNAWTEQVEERCHYLQQNSHQSIMILDQNDQRLCENGQIMLQNIKNQLVNFWSKIESALQYPKVRFSNQAQKLLQSIITIEAFDCSCLKGDEWQSMERTKLQDFSAIETNKNESILNEVSLLDISSNGFRFEEEQSAIDISRISLVNSTLESPKDHNLEKSQVSQINKMKRAKSRQFDLNMSLINSLQKKTSFKSPKEKQKTMVFSKKSISSPITPTPKARLRKFVLKVKEPQKFDKIVTGLESDSINSVDLTGFEIGDEGAKQLCMKIIQCKKPRLLRLMKNSLTDQSIKEVVETLKVIDYLNLAQNNFTEKILDCLLQMQRKEPAGKGKTVQLGQNQLNSRKLKEKIEELKKLGVMITL